MTSASVQQSAVLIRRPAAPDRAAWMDLWRGYLRCYRAKLDESVCDATWTRVIAGDEIHGFVAEADGALIGFTNYLFHATTWAQAQTCYLQDLYVAADARGAGAGRKLMNAVFDDSKKAGVPNVYWLTQEFNADARALYDTLGRRTSFIQYRLR